MIEEIWTTWCGILPIQAVAWHVSDWVWRRIFRIAGTACCDWLYRTGRGVGGHASRPTATPNDSVWTWWSRLCQNNGKTSVPTAAVDAGADVGFYVADRLMLSSLICFCQHDWTPQSIHIRICFSCSSLGSMMYLNTFADIFFFKSYSPVCRCDSVVATRRQMTQRLVCYRPVS